MSLLKPFDYDLPKRFIAHEPAAPRDSAKLLVYKKNSNEIEHRIFSELDQLLTDEHVLVLNDTKVYPARIIGTKETGGKIELLITELGSMTLRALTNRKLSNGSKVILPSGDEIIAQGKNDRGYVFSTELPMIALRNILESHGSMPLPPYIHTSLPEEKVRSEYQTVFAEQEGSSAAPTASLHFTDELLKRIREKGIQIEEITLHVGLGTFAPVTEEQIHIQKLHSEQYVITEDVAQRINSARSQGKKIIAVGTTVVRALESAMENGRLTHGLRLTQLFIQPGYPYQCVDGMITNFHVPRSSLMMMVAALMGREELLRCYEEAKRENYRFFSFGDGMLIY